LREGGPAAGADWIAILAAIGIAVAVAVICSAGVIAARRNLIERGGSVDCGLRHGRDRRWRPGLAEYRPLELRWHPVFGIRLRPAEVFQRRLLRVVARRPADAVEATRLGLGPGAVVVECDTGAGGGRVELALSEDALTGFLAWLEAAPPGPGPEFG
jgi:Protein of unknown function (DUF2550)